MADALELPLVNRGRRRRWQLRAATLFVLLSMLAPRSFAQIAEDPTVMFLRHVDDYLTLRAQLRQSVAPEHIIDPHIRAISGPLLAARIRHARTEAMVGDLIPADLADIVRDRLRRAFHPVEIDVLLSEHYPAGLPEAPVQLNVHYDNNVAVAPPVGVLSALPPLPGALGYRLIGCAVVLWDEEAEIVLDLITDALPQPRVWDFLEVSSTDLRQCVRNALITANLDPRVLIEEMAQHTQPGALPPAVDEKFDWGAGSLIPPSVLQALPPLPSQLEYRFVGSALVVIDVQSGYIKGILWGALQRQGSSARFETCWCGNGR